MKKVYTSVDIGTDTIKFIVGEEVNNAIYILAAHEQKSSGVKKGLIVDANLTINAIKDGIKEINAKLGIDIKKVIVNVPSYNAKFTLVTSEVELVQNVVESSHISQIIKNATTDKFPDDGELVTVIPIDFAIDDIKGIVNPIGKNGKMLRMKGIMITTPKKNIYSVVSVIVGAGLEVVDIALGGLGDYFEVRNNATDHQVGAVINVGHETTTISVVNRGKLMNAEVLQLGGKNVDKDLALMLGINIFDARDLKEKFGSAHKRFSGQTETCEIKDINGNVLKLNQIEVTEIINLRLKEILEMAKKQLLSLTKQNISYIILTGGATEIKSFKYLAYEIFGKDVIIYSVSTLGVRDNKYTTSLGLIKYFCNKMKIRGKKYSMIMPESEVDLITPKNKYKKNNEDTVITKIFGGLFSNNKEEKR